MPLSTLSTVRTPLSSRPNSTRVIATAGEFYVPSRGDVVLDVGAHIGLFTLRMLQEQPLCRVIALEPSPENFACLKRNLQMLGPERWVEIHQLGIGATFGRIKMMEIPSNRSVDARTIPATDTDGGTLRVVPLRYLFEMAGTPTISLLKMDAEGAEYDAFATADSSLFPRIELVAMEYHDNYIPGTLAMLRERFAATHDLTIMPDPGQLHGRLFAVRKATVETAVPMPRLGQVPAATSI
jgi:FkbM family methyltransferase